MFSWPSLEDDRIDCWWLSRSRRLCQTLGATPSPTDIRLTYMRRATIFDAKPLRSLIDRRNFKCGCDSLELGQRSGQVLNDFAGDDLRGRQVVQVLQGLVTQPCDVEVGLVPCHQLVVGEEPEALRHHPLRASLARRKALDELVKMVTPQRVLLQGEVLVGAQVIDPQPLGPRPITCGLLVE